MPTPGPAKTPIIAQQTRLAHLKQLSLHIANLYHCGSGYYYQNSCVFQAYILSGFKKALLQNPRQMIRGRIFSEMIRVQARKSELQAKSRSYGPKVGDTARQTPRIRTEPPRKGPRMGFRCFYRNPPLKPS